jgi:hypothetical protein
VKKSLGILSVLILGIGVAASATAPQVGPAAPQAAPQPVSFDKLPLDFIPNRGEADPEARYYVRTGHYTLWLTQDGLIFDSTKSALPAGRDVTSLDFIGAATDPEIVPVETTSHVVNFIIGSDPARWRTGIETSRAVLYKGLYDGIDLKVYGVEKEVEYDWIVKPGADPGMIEFAYNGNRTARIDREGNLVVGTAFGDIVHRKPSAYQIVNGRKNEVSARFRALEKGAYGFDLGPYDSGAELVIDPAVLLYGTYLGGSKSDGMYSIALVSGAICGAGTTESANFPMRKAYDPSFNGAYDGFIFKLAPDGQSLAFSTFLGGSRDDYIWKMVIDRDGGLLVCGATLSSDFPTVNAYDSTANGGEDIFVAKLDATGRKLVYSTYIGGSKHDEAWSIARSPDGGLVVSGCSNSVNFPVKNAYDSTWDGDWDSVLLKLSEDGEALVFSTYFGGKSFDYINDQAVDAAGYIYVAGGTNSPDLPVKNAFQASCRGKSDGFLAKFSPAGDSLSFATYLGGTHDDMIVGIGLDAQGSILVAGTTYSSSFPIKKAWDATFNGKSDAFIAKFASTGKSLVFSTFLGGGGSDEMEGMALDGDGNIWVSGYTYSTNFPMRNAYDQTINGNCDGFISRLSSTGAALTFSTYLGGSRGDSVDGIAVGTNGEVILMGYTSSPNFPVKNAYDQTWNGADDSFIVKLKVPAGSSSAKR